MITRSFNRCPWTSTYIEGDHLGSLPLGSLQRVGGQPESFWRLAWTHYASVSLGSQHTGTSPQPASPRPSVDRCRAPYARMKDSQATGGLRDGLPSHDARRSC
jgi:hypothetical protein